MNEQIDKTINFSFKATLHVWSALASTNQLWYTFYVYLLSFESLEIYLHYEHHFFLCGEKSWQFSNIKYDFFCLRFSKYSRIYATESLKVDVSANILAFTLRNLRSCSQSSAASDDMLQEILDCCLSPDLSPGTDDHIWVIWRLV